MLVVVPTFGRENRPGEADGQDRRRDDAVPEVDAGHGRQIDARPHQDEFGDQNTEEKEDQQVMADGKSKIEHRPFLQRSR